MSGWGIVHQFSLEVIEWVLIGILFWSDSSLLLSAFPLTVFFGETSFSTIWFSDTCILGFACKNLVSSTSGWCLLLCVCRFIKILSGEHTGKVVLVVEHLQKVNIHPWGMQFVTVHNKEWLACRLSDSISFQCDAGSLFDIKANRIDCQMTPLYLSIWPFSSGLYGVVLFMTAPYLYRNMVSWERSSVTVNVGRHKKTNLISSYWKFLIPYLGSDKWMGTLENSWLSAIFILSYWS